MRRVDRNIRGELPVLDRRHSVSQEGVWIEIELCRCAGGHRHVAPLARREDRNDQEGIREVNKPRRVYWRAWGTD